MELSSRIQQLSESQTIAMSKMARELKAKGVDVISLSLGEPDFDTPELIKDAAKAAIDENFSHYTAVGGYQGLIDAICTKFKRDNNLHYKPSQVLASTGAKQCLVNVLMSIINRGHEVILPTPYWVSYLEMIKLAEGTPVMVQGTFENGFKLKAEDLEKAISPNTRAMFINSPSNPTGAVYTREELEEIAAVLRKHPNIIVISDEIYEHINYGGEHVSFASLDGMFDRTVTVNGVSKAFAMTGWRLGYLGAPEWLAQACIKMQGQVTSATCSITQKAAEAALLADPKELTKDMLKAFEARRELVVGELNKIDGLEILKTDGAFYCFPKVSSYFGKSYGGFKINNATDLCMYLIQEAHVACVTGDAFGAEECLRISYAASESDLKIACKRLQEAFAKLK